MSARERLVEALMNPGLVGLGSEEADELIANFAHELAEEIRGERDAMMTANPSATREEIDAVSYAASVIDPFDREGERPASSEAPRLSLVDDVCNATLQGWPLEVVDECVREAGHYNEADPESWHQSEPDPDGNRRRWSDSASGATPHRAGSVRPDEEPTP